MDRPPRTESSWILNTTFTHLQIFHWNLYNYSRLEVVTFNELFNASCFQSFTPRRIQPDELEQFSDSFWPDHLTIGKVTLNVSKFSFNNLQTPQLVKNYTVARANVLKLVYGKCKQNDGYSQNGHCANEKY